MARFVGENNSPSGRVLACVGGVCRVLLDNGQEVEATAVRAIAPGARTTLSIRPERVLIGADADGAPTRLPGRVRDLIYVGDHLRAYIAVGAQEFIVKVPNSRHVPLSIGDDDPGRLAHGGLSRARSARDQGMTIKDREDQR